MKLHYLQKNLQSDIKVSFYKEKEFLKLWHYHPEIEIVYIARGEGTLYTGDYIGSFKKGDLFFIGSNVPHMFDSSPFDEIKNEFSASYVIHANKNFFPEITDSKSSFYFVKNILKLSQRGLVFKDSDDLEFLQILDKMNSDSDLENGVSFLSLLLKLYQQPHKSVLSSENWLEHYEVKDVRLNKIMKYIMQNFQKEINLDDVANISGMNKSAFCRYFKVKTGKSFVTFLNELRINYSCKLLSDTDPVKSIAEACYQSGFNSLSYYNRTFKKQKGVAPRLYKKELFS